MYKDLDPDTWPEKMAEFVTICCETATGLNGEEVKLTREKISSEAYPEQLNEAFNICLKLNRVSENLKKFAAPIPELGAQDKAENKN
jgi:hypothetical protein